MDMSKFAVTDRPVRTAIHHHNRVRARGPSKQRGGTAQQIKGLKRKGDSKEYGFALGSTHTSKDSR